MKIIKYHMTDRVNIGTAEEPSWENRPGYEISADYSSATLEIAQMEAYNGEYEIVEDGRPDPADTPTQLDAIEAQVAYTAMMTDTLLEV